MIAFSKAIESNKLAPFILAFVLGAILTLAFSPIDLAAALPISLSIILYLLDTQKTKKSQFLLGWCFGYGHFLTALYWISIALLVDISHFAWMIPLVLIAIPGVIGCFIGMLFITCSYLKGNKIVFSLTFSILWVFFELLRSYIILPFPWLALGYASNFSIYFMQLLSIIGIYGMSFFICLISTSFYTRNSIYIIILLACLALSLIWGKYRIPDQLPRYNDYVFNIIQPNILEHHMGNQKKQYLAFNTLMDLSINSVHQPKTIIFWPEAGFPFGYHDKSPWQPIISTLVPNDGYLVTGVDRHILNNDYPTFSYNSLIAFNAEGEMADHYDKKVLVPFGEYIPLRSLMPSVVEKVAYGIGDFNVGERYNLIDLRHNIPKMLPLICYESIFPFFITNFDLKNTDVLLNITNDAWFGNTIGPYQHAAMARARTVEFGKPLIRIANNGISMIVDQFGRIEKSLPLYQQGIIETDIPIASKELTFYARHPYAFLIMLMGLFIMIVTNQLFNKKIKF